MLSLLVLFFGLNLHNSMAHAHYVTYKGGLAVWSQNQPHLSDNYIGFTFEPRTSIGLRQERHETNHGRYTGVWGQLTQTVKRWTRDNFQANLNAYAGMGRDQLEGHNSLNSYLWGLEADAESRSVYFLAKVEGYHTRQMTDHPITTVRYGQAAYLSEVDQLSQWLIFQVKIHPEIAHGVTVTPFLRSSYRTVLWEIGSSFRGEWMFNMMVHF